MEKEYTHIKIEEHRPFSKGNTLRSVETTINTTELTLHEIVEIFVRLLPALTYNGTAIDEILEKL